MKTAILLTGNVRSWDICRASFENTFKHLDADIFVSTYDVQYGHHPHIQSSVVGDNADVLLTSEYIINLFHGLNVKGIDIETMDFDRKYPCHPRFAHLHNNVFAPIDKLHRALGMMFEEERRQGITYDTVIKTRADILYLQNVDLAYPDRGVVIDDSNTFPNDWIFITARDSLSQMAKFLQAEILDPVYPDSEHTPPHTLYLNSTRHSGLDLIARPIAQGLVRKNNILQQYR